VSSKRNPNANDLWQTPSDLRELIHRFVWKMDFERLTLDPATTQENPMGAEFIRTPECDPDGLETEWFHLLHEDARFVYVNPPYRKAWYSKIFLEATRMAAAAPGCHMLALLPAKPGTKYFGQLVESASANLFITGRLTFQGATEPATFESALMYWGNKRHHFAVAFEELGWVI